MSHLWSFGKSSPSQAFFDVHFSGASVQKGSSAGRPKGMKASELRKTFPDYQIAKNRIDLTPETDVDAILVKVKEMFAADPEAVVNDIDGVKIDFPTKWVHLRKSNTEPIIRVYSEAQTMDEADALGKKLMQVVYDMQ